MKDFSSARSVNQKSYIPKDTISEKKLYFIPKSMLQN